MVQGGNEAQWACIRVPPLKWYCFDQYMLLFLLWKVKSVCVFPCIGRWSSLEKKGGETKIDDILLSGGFNIVQFNHKHGLQSNSCHCGGESERWLEVTWSRPTLSRHIDFLFRDGGSPDGVEH